MKEKPKNTYKPIDTNYELNLSTTYSVAECIEQLQSLANPRDMSFKVIIKKKRKDMHRFTLVHINKYGTRTIIHGRFTAQINGNTHVMSKVGMPYPPALDVILLGISLLLMVFAGLSDVLWAKFFFFGVFMLVAVVGAARTRGNPDGRYVLELLEQLYSTGKSK